MISNIKTKKILNILCLYLGLFIVIYACGIAEENLLDALLLESTTGENTEIITASVDPLASSDQKLQAPENSLVAGAFAIFPAEAFVENTSKFTVSLAPGIQNITKQVIEDLKKNQLEITVEKYFPSVTISTDQPVQLKSEKVFEIAVPIIDDLASLALMKDKARYAIFYQVYNHETKKIMSGIKLRSSVYFYEQNENFLIIQTRYFGVYQAVLLTQKSYDQINSDLEAESLLTTIKTKFDKEIYTTVKATSSTEKIEKEEETSVVEEKTVEELVDTDSDGIADSADNCVNTKNPGQEDIDKDDKGDVCDSDKDGDSVANIEDAFPSNANETLDVDGDGVGDNSDNCPNVSNADQTDSDNDGRGNACPIKTYQENFTNGQAATAQCDVWKDWIPTLEQNYTKVVFSSSEDPLGVVCEDPTIVNALAKAIKDKTNFNETCNGRQWTLCGTRYEGELWIDPPSLCSGSNCPNPGWIIRPCIGGSNSNWGGGNTNTCGGVSQTMTLKFE